MPCCWCSTRRERARAGRPVHRGARARRPAARRDRPQQGRRDDARRRSPSASPRWRGSATSTRSIRSARSRATGSTRCATSSSRCCRRGPPYFPEAARTDQPASFRIAELIRERALALTREEVPHALAVTVDELLPPRGARAGRVHAVIAVETESQQRMLIGKGGSMVRAIGRCVASGHRAARRRIDLPRSHGQGPPRLAGRRVAGRSARGRRPVRPGELSKALEPTLLRPNALASEIDDAVHARRARARRLRRRVPVLGHLRALAARRQRRARVRGDRASVRRRERGREDRRRRRGGARRRARHRGRRLARGARERRLPGGARRARQRRARRALGARRRARARGARELLPRGSRAAAGRRASSRARASTARRPRPASARRVRPSTSCACCARSFRRAAWSRPRAAS